MLDRARQYLGAGLCVLPARRTEKRPSVGQWKRYRDRLPTEAELCAWLANGHDALCIVCGAVSGHAEMIDFDAGGELFEAWAAKIPSESLARLVIERTQRGGRHVFYRSAQAVCGNMKLAQRKDGEKVITLIETRGEGGLFLCAPTLGYEIIQGDLAGPPVLLESERDLLLQAAWELNQYVPPVVGSAPGPVAMNPAIRSGSHAEQGERPGDEFNRRGDVRGILEQAGWVCVREGDNQYWRRPGKDSGWSATLRGQVFYVFSASADPFEPNRAYSPFAVYALLNHGGDFELAAGALRLAGYGSDLAADPGDDVDISGIMGGAPDFEPAPPIPDPGPMPPEMLRMPGFVGEVMDYCLATAPYPNPVMAFAGAVSLMAFLAGRKVRDSGDNRTNFYLLGLAHSSAGKDWPRKINTRIVHEVGLAECLGERFASGEGIQDALFQTPAMLFQTDEIDGLLQSINKSKDARHEAIMSTLLTMYSSANSVFPMRRKAGKEAPGVIDQPNLVIFGTAIPNHYYEALSERMLTNGFFARMIILESGARPQGQEPSIRDIPPRVLSTAKWWAKYRPGTGNLLSFHPVPAVVEHSDQAKQLLVETRQHAEAEYSSAESRSDSVGTTAWGRVSEQVRKLALLYAVSENHQAPRISLAAVEWASAFVMHQTRRMLFMAAGHVAENPFHAECLKLMRRLREAPDGQMARNKLMRAMRCKLTDFDQIVGTLLMQGDIVPVEIPTKTKTAQGYRLS